MLEGFVAIYTTLFTATDEELTAFLPVWHAPMSAPSELSARNPFTGKEITVTSWFPPRSVSEDESPSIYELKGRSILPPIVEPSGEWLDYQKWWEDNAPPLLRTFPHVAMRSIAEFELQALGTMLVGGKFPPARSVSCREGSIGAIQAAAIPLLATASDQQLSDYARNWAIQLRNEELQLLWALVRIRALARDAEVRGASLFSHCRTFV